MATLSTKGGGGMDAEQYQRLALAILSAIPLDLDNGIADRLSRDPVGIQAIMRQVLDLESKRDWKTELFKKLDMKITVLNLRVPAMHSLNSECFMLYRAIEYLGELVQIPSDKLLKRKNFGQKTVADTIKELEHFGLSLGMDVMGWVPPDQRNK